jgi:hypothetical protein
MKRFSYKRLILAAIIVLSILGGLIAIYATTNGPWGYTDPVEYISVARSLDQGHGLGYYEGSTRFTPETIHPPFYSLTLALIGLFGVDLVAASRWLNILAFIASIFISGWIFYRHSRAPALGVITSTLMCAFPWMVVWFSSSYSEPLFVVTILAGGLCLLEYLNNEKPWLLIVSALVVGLIPGTRYAGIGMVAAGAAMVLIFSSGKLWSRVKKTLAFGLVAGLPILAWLGWVYFSTAHQLGGRTPELFRADIAAHFQTFRGIFLDTVWKWVPYQSDGSMLRYRDRFVLVGIGSVVIPGLCLWAQRRLRRLPGEGTKNSGMLIFAFFGLASLIFVAVLIATYLFTLPTIDIDNRMLLPLFVCMVMTLYAAFGLWLAAWFDHGWKRWLQVLPWLLLAVSLAWYIPQTQDKVKFFHLGDGLTVYRWNHSGIIQAVRDLPADQPVISNDWELTMLWTGRPIYGLWPSFPVTSPIQAGAYGTAAEDTTQAIFCQQNAALVIYNDFPTQYRNQVGVDQLPVSEMPLFKGLTVYGKYADGMIFLCH